MLKMETNGKKNTTPHAWWLPEPQGLPNTRMSLCGNMFLCADLLTVPAFAPAVIRRQNCKG